MKMSDNCFRRIIYGGVYGLVILVMALLPLAANAQAPDVAGLKLYADGREGFVSARGIASDIRTQINGTLARTDVVQYFYNNTNDWQEGIYSFPIPQDASADKLVMVVGDKRILGFVAEKEKARHIYEQAKREGRAGGLVEAHRANIFRTSVANIPPKSLVAIEISYQHSVKIDGGRFSLRLPLAITPRFDTIQAEEILQANAHEAELSYQHALKERVRLMGFENGGNSVRYTLGLNPGFAAENISSPSHSLQVSQKEGERYALQPGQDILPGEQDFVVQWDMPKTDDPTVFQHTETVQGDVYTHLVIVPPAKSGGAVAAKRQVTFILDTSGSMSGPSIKQAKASLRQALYDLEPGDLFNVVHFNSYSETLYSDVKPTTAQTVQKALRWVSVLQAQGGTRMFPALDAAFAQEQREGYLNQIVFITDGAIGYESKLGQYIQEHVGNARFFAVGIGAAPNAHLMETIARYGRGSFTFIGELSDVQSIMGALFHKMKYPAVTDLALDIKGMGDGAVDIVPSALPDLFSGDVISVVIKSDKAPQDIVVQGHQGEQPWSVHLPDSEPQDHATGISKIYAHRKIQDIKMSVGRDNKEQSAREMSALAVKHQIVSEYTSLVAVDEMRIRPENANILPHLYHPNLPKGWGLAHYDPAEAAEQYKNVQDREAEMGMKRHLKLPKTNTGFMLLIVLGCLLIAVSLIILRVERRYV